MSITPADPFAQFAVLLRDIERRIANLEQMNRLSNSSFTGRLRMIGPNGEDRGYLGELPDGGYGIAITDEAGNPVFRVDEGGMRNPALNLPVRAAQAPVSTSSASWEVTWEVGVLSRTHPAIRWRSTISVDPGTTAEAQIYLFQGAHQGGAITLGTGQHVVEWNWELPNWPLGIGNSRLVQMRLRRLTGTGMIHAYGPDASMGTVADLGATPGGNPRVL